MRRLLAIFGLLALGGLVGFGPAELSRADESRIDFAHDIVPLLRKRCGECHTEGKAKGGLSFDSREAILMAKAVVVGNSAESKLVQRILSTEQDERMPLERPPLAVREIALLKAWIDQGLTWERGFSFQASSYAAPLKPRRPELPAADVDRPHPIDRIVGAYAASRNVALSPNVDDATFARRASLDLIGLLPTAGEVEFLLQDSLTDKRVRFVRRLLDDRRAYADHWLSFWNDLLRNDYRGTGYIDGGRKQISGWLYQALLDNKPYDKFAAELLSPTADSEGFINGIKWRGRVNASQVREIQFSQNVSQVFFGMNLKCASCHDSFIDSWKLDDAYRLAAIVADAPLEIHRCDKATGRMATAGFLWPELGEIDPALPKEQRLARFAELVTHPENGRFTRTIVNRVWHGLFGHGLVHPVDVMSNRPWSEDLLDYLASYLLDSNYDLKQLLEHIVSSRTYQSRHVIVESETATNEYVFRGPELKRLSAEQFLDAVWQLTGTAPTKIDAPVKLGDFSATVPDERRFLRVALVNCDPLMRSLGRPNREQVVTTRGDVLTTLQALELSNGEILAETLQRGAGLLLNRHAGKSADSIVTALFRDALSRSPTADELEAARAVIGESATHESLTDVVWIIVMLPEFQLIR